MKRVMSLVGSCAIAFLLCCAMSAQEAANAPPAAAAVSAVVPQLVNYSGVAVDPQGKPLAGIAGVTLAIYSVESNGTPLWMETQNVIADGKGHYTVQLGASSSTGLPLDLFASGEARWLGVRVNNEEEQPRVLLLSVPYALKAADAQTLGGLSASAFVLAGQASSSATASPGIGSTDSLAGASTAPQGAPPAGTVTGTGTTDFLPLWTNSSTIGNSALFQSGTGATAKVGIGTNKPGSTLDVKGAATIRGIFALPATGVATATAGANSQPQTLAASVFNSTTSTPVTQTFEWQAEPVGNDTVTAGGSLNLLYAQGTSKPAETGLNISSNGQISFATGQKFPGTGSGTVTSVASGAGLAGGPITLSGTLSISSAGVTNAMLQNPSLTVTATSPLTGGGSVALGGTTSLGLKTCSSNQVLEYVSGAWTCTNAGTVTSVAMTAPSSDFTVSGSPVTSTGTLALNWTVAPTSTDTANAIVKRDGFGNISTGDITASGIAASAANVSNGGSDYAPLFSVDNAASGSYTTAVFGDSAYNYGVWGSSISGIGVYGVSSSNIGVYGSSTSSGGVYGTSSTYPGIWGTSGSSNAVFGANSATGDDAVRGDSFNPGKAGVSAFNWEEDGTALYSWAEIFSTSAYFDGEYGHCLVDAYGNLQCTGTKSAVVPVDGGSRQVALYAVEAPENWFEDAGSGQLSNGTALVELEPIFVQTVNTATDYHVFLTPNGDCKGLYVSQKLPASFVVHELGGGSSNVTFDYRVMVKRKGYETVRLADETRTFAKHRVQPKPRPGIQPLPHQQVLAPRPMATGHSGMELVNKGISPKP